MKIRIRMRTSGATTVPPHTHWRTSKVYVTSFGLFSSSLKSDTKGRCQSKQRYGHDPHFLLLHCSQQSVCCSQVATKWKKRWQHLRGSPRRDVQVPVSEAEVPVAEGEGGLVLTPPKPPQTKDSLVQLFRFVRGGQSGFAVLSIECKRQLVRHGLIKVEEMVTNEATVVME